MSALAPLLPAAGGRSRVRALIVLALAALLPLALLAVLVPQRDDPPLPAALVNLDVPVQSGDTPVAAGKLLTENLITSGGPLQWTLTDPGTAAAGLAQGTFIAIVTIPSDFSADAASLDGDAPVAATLGVQTSASHGAVVGTLADALTAALPAGVSAQLTSGYVGGLLTAFGDVRTGIGEAGQGAAEIAAATSAAAGGAAQLRDATAEVAGGVRDVAAVLGGLPPGARDLGALTAAGAADADVLAGVLAVQSVGAADALRAQRDAAAELAALIAAVQADPMAPAGEMLSRLAGLQGRIAEVQRRLDGQSAVLAAEAVDAVALAAGSATIASLSDPVADGLAELADITAVAAAATERIAVADGQLSSGLATLASGSDELSTSLSQVAGALPQYTDAQQKQIADVVAAPIGLERSGTPAADAAWLSALGVVGPVGLWVAAALALLVLAPYARNALSTSAPAWRIALPGAVAAAAVTLAAAALVWVVLAVFGAAPARLAPALGLLAAAAVCFALVHQLLTAALGRAGIVVSALLLVVQLLAAGTLAPAAVAPEADTPLALLPLSIALRGSDALLAGSLHGALAAAVGLGIWTVLAVAGILATVAVQRRRRILALVA